MLHSGVTKFQDTCVIAIFSGKKNLLSMSRAAFLILKFDLFLFVTSASKFHACPDLSVCRLFVSNCPNRTQSEFELGLTGTSPAARAVG